MQPLRCVQMHPPSLPAVHHVPQPVDYLKILELLGVQLKLADIASAGVGDGASDLVPLVKMPGDFRDVCVEGQLMPAAVRHTCLHAFGLDGIHWKWCATLATWFHDTY